MIAAAHDVRCPFDGLGKAKDLIDLGEAEDHR
jgi:hypothetical protein